MTVREIRLYGDPVLRTVTDEVKEFGESSRALAQDLLDTLDKPGRAGVAAPQIGVPARAGAEFGVLQREMGVGGQMLQLQGLAGQYDDVFVPLYGAHQAENAALAVASVEAFIGGGREGIDPEAVQAAFARVTSPGRLEALRRGPVVLADAAHNPAGADALATALAEDFAATRLVAVVAVLAEKDVEGILAALEPVVEDVVVTVNSSPRCLPPEDVLPIAVDVFGDERVHQAVPLIEAIDLGLSLAEQQDVIGGHGVVVTGSVVTAGDARVLFGVGQ